MLRIDRIMKENGITTQELGLKMQVSTQYISEVVNERKNITMSGLAKFAEALDVPMAALFEGYHEADKLRSHHFTCPYCGNIIDAVKVQ